MKIIEGHENYVCSVVKLPALQDVPGLDNLKKVTIFGNDCLVGKDSESGKLHLFFPAECKISPTFLFMNNLYRENTSNEDTTQKGFFESTGRVKAIKFRGVISTGFVIPVESLEGVVDGKVTLKEGDEFNELEGLLLCQKYVVKHDHATSTAKESRFNKKLKRFSKLIPNQFRFHLATPQLGKNLHKIKPDSYLVITDKWHGTSAVFANVLVRKELTWYKKLAAWIVKPILGKYLTFQGYDNLYSSRSVIKNQYINKEAGSGYYGEDIWKTVHEEIKDKIEQGITIYGEIVGYTNSGKAIQKGYDYGCSPGVTGVEYHTPDMPKPEHKFVVYRITYTKPDGNVIEFNWNMIEQYCKKHGLQTVPVLTSAYAFEINKALIHGRNPEYEQAIFDGLSQLFLEKDCTYCKNKVPAEGIVVRLDHHEGFEVYKLKSKRFLEKETKELDKGEVNIEDEQEEQTATTV